MALPNTPTEADFDSELVNLVASYDAVLSAEEHGTRGANGVQYSFGVEALVASTDILLRGLPIQVDRPAIVEAIACSTVGVVAGVATAKLEPWDNDALRSADSNILPLLDQDDDSPTISATGGGAITTPGSESDQLWVASGTDHYVLLPGVRYRLVLSTTDTSGNLYASAGIVVRAPPRRD